MICPVCAVDAAPAALAGPVFVCGACGASYIVALDGTSRRASNVDTAALAPTDLALLQRARGRLARGDRRTR